MASSIKEVDFAKYCPLCENFSKKEDEDPCYDCLATPTNISSHKPVFYTAK